ncbi:J domain-containing protein [Candidatus Poribacteria bacterium]|nr:J domain-containing protein [Candidatus Poribacteria bacterium]
MTKDYYETLGLKKDATDEEIKRTYRTLAKKFHPDNNPGNKVAEEHFKKINEAYEYLGDPEKRKQYDSLREASIHGNGADFSDLFNKGYRSTGQGQSQGSNNFNFADIFSSIFGNENRNIDRDSNNEESSYEITIPFEQAITGGQTKISVPVKSLCPACSGTGAKPGTSIKTCSNCGGRGSISMSQGSAFAFSQPCPRCFGRGTIVSSPCTTCRGEGNITQQKDIAVNIPAGINDGAILHASVPDSSGGKYRRSENINLTVRVAPHHFFERKGYDIYCEITINIAQSILGSRVKVKTISGSVIIKIPQGTQPDALLRIPDQGVVKPSGEYGNQYVKIKIKVPEKINDKQMKLMDEFAKISDLKY